MFKVLVFEENRDSLHCPWCHLYPTHARKRERMEPLSFRGHPTKACSRRTAGIHWSELQWQLNATNTLAALAAIVTSMDDDDDDDDDDGVCMRRCIS